MGKIARSGLFLGEYRYRLDEKYRIALPKRLRVEIEGFEVVLSRGFEPCISAYDLARWQKIAEVPLAIPGFEERGRQLRRQIFSSAVILELDAQGRVVIPEHLVKWANITEKEGKEIIVIGAGDHFELWEEDNWKKYSHL